MDVKIALAGIAINISFPRNVIGRKYPYLYKDFFAKEKPQVFLEGKEGLPENLSLGKTLFDTNTWVLSKNNNSYIIQRKGPLITQAAIFNMSFTKGRVYYQKNNYKRPTFFLNPFDAPLIHILLINLLSDRGGVLVHSCGVIDNKEGILFVGKSGSGKSTIARIYKGLKNSTILSDEQTIIIKKDGRFFIYGTPWHGTARLSSPKSAELKKIFFIGHSKRHQVIRLDKLDGAAGIFRNAFIPYWNKEKIRKTLSTCSKISGKLKAYQLVFSRNRNLIDFIRSV